MMINKYIIWGLGGSDIPKFEKLTDLGRNPVNCEDPGGFLANCKAARGYCHEKKNLYFDLQRKHNNLIDDFNRISSGLEQRDYDLQTSQSQYKQQEIIKLKAEKEQKRKLRDAWRDNPEKVDLVGLNGFWSGLVNSVNCDSVYDEKNKLERNYITPLKEKISKIEQAISDYTAKQSQLKIMKQHNQDLEQELNSYKNDLLVIEKEIEDYKKAYETRKNAEKLSLNNQSVAENAEEKAKKELEKDKKDNTMLWVAVGLGLGACLFLFSGDDKKTKD